MGRLGRDADGTIDRAGLESALMCVLGSPRRDAFLTALICQLAGWAVCSASVMGEAGDSGEAIPQLAICNEMILLIAKQLDNSDSGEVGLPDTVFTHYVCGKASLIKDQEAFPRTVRAVRRIVAGIPRESHRMSRYSGIRSAPTDTLVARIGRALTASSLEEALHARTELFTVVDGGRVGEDAAEGVSLLLAGLGRGVGSASGIGVCLDLIVELAYSLDLQSASALTECLTPLSDNFDILLRLANSTNTLIALGALELAWIASVDRAQVQVVASSLRPEQTTVDNEWPGLTSGDLRSSLGRLISAILTAPNVGGGHRDA